MMQFKITIINEGEVEIIYNDEQNSIENAEKSIHETVQTMFPIMTVKSIKWNEKKNRATVEIIHR